MILIIAGLLIVNIVILFFIIFMLNVQGQQIRDLLDGKK
jgi:hypothetical protein